MRIINSAINQVGRDLGKVVSNQIFKDSHSTPIRISGQNSNNTVTVEKKRQVKSQFDKELNFTISGRPSTIVTKLASLFIAMKESVNEYKSDGYLDTDEFKESIRMIQEFINKLSNVGEILNLDPIKNENEINIASAYIEKTNNLIQDVCNFGIDGCNAKIDFINSKLKETEINIEKKKKSILNKIWPLTKLSIGSLMIIVSITNTILAEDNSQRAIPILLIIIGFFLAKSGYSGIKGISLKENKDISYLEEIKEIEYKRIDALNRAKLLKISM